jgi:hypothetical protein
LLEREFDLAMAAGVLPPMPPEMMEAGGEYEIEGMDKDVLFAPEAKKKPLPRPAKK